jgi:ubiquinone/menaquinone biosynthesis C-methylase UbiE
MSPSPSSPILPVLEDKQGWDQYWEKKSQNKGKLLYDWIAEIYRKKIIRPSLNHFIGKYLPPHAQTLHAGCGSGQVDRDIRHRVQITALDISPAALAVYEKENGNLCKIVHGSILQIPLESNSIEGIYNLGVMEHFTQEEIEHIFSEFRRVLKPGGRVILFWPPEYGLSVLFFKVLGRTLKWMTGRTFKFHPDEICRIQSKKHALQVLNQAQMKYLEYSFGIRDLFTYSVLVAEK